MSMSTREDMRRELKELAKLAETMGKETPAEPAADLGSDVAYPGAMLQRPSTPASSSRVSVPPFATPTLPPVFDPGDGLRPRSGKRTGIIAVLVGASLAAALVGGAFVGRSLAGGSGASVPPVTAAAAVAPQAPVTPPAEAPAPPPAVAPQAPAAPDPVAAPTVAAVTPKATSPAATPAAAPAHKQPQHAAVAKPSAAPKPAVASAASNPQPPAPASDSASAPKTAAAAAAAPPLAKPKPAAAPAGGGSDSLEDLIRKEVAAQKK
jgi:hypothetical protein